MLRNNQPWDLGDPDVNDRGQPVIHDIAQKLGCIRPNSDIDLPVHSVFPEDEAGMAELARQLEEQQHHDSESQHKESKETTDSPRYNRTDRASSSELDHSDIELDYRRAAFGSHNPMTMSPQSYAGSTDYEFSRAGSDLDASALFTAQSPNLSTFPDWTLKAAVPPEMTMQYFQQTGMFQGMSIMGPGLTGNDFGTIKPHVLSAVSHPNVMMGLSDPMIYGGYDEESMRL